MTSTSVVTLSRVQFEADSIERLQGNIHAIGFAARLGREIELVIASAGEAGFVINRCAEQVGDRVDQSRHAMVLKGELSTRGLLETDRFVALRGLELRSILPNN